MQFGKVSKVVPVRPEKLLKAKNQLMSDFNALLEDAEELLRSTATASGDAVSGARSRLEGSLQQVRSRVADAQTAIATGYDRTAAVTQAYVEDNPWKVAGAAAVIGLLIGALISSSRR